METKREYFHAELKSKRFGLIKSSQWSYKIDESQDYKKKIEGYCVEDIMIRVNEWSLDQCWGHKKHEAFTQRFSDELEKNVTIVKDYIK